MDPIDELRQFVSDPRRAWILACVINERLADARSVRYMDRDMSSEQIRTILEWGMVCFDKLAGTTLSDKAIALLKDGGGE